MKKAITILALFICAFGFSQTSINGVVTYYFNEYQGDKPDLGAKVVVIDSVKTKVLDYKLYERYSNARFYKHLCESYIELMNGARKKDKPEYQGKIDEYTLNLKQLDAETPDKFDALDKMFAINVRDFEKESVTEKTIDNTGSYNLSLKPGTYYVCMFSKNRTRTTISEVSGQIHIEKVKIIDGQSKDVSYNFKI